jgi:IS605 OrfB family transposase
VLQEHLSHCQPGSRRAQRLLRRKAQVSAKLYRQQRDLLHQAARKVVSFCQAEGVSRIAAGDVRDIQTGVNLGKQTNQKISQWPHGQFARYLTEKAARRGITVEWIDEAYSTRTCSVSGHVQPSSPRGRRFRCSGCGARVHRDVNGSANICSRAIYGRYSKIQADTVKYLRPIGVAPLTRAQVVRVEREPPGFSRGSVSDRDVERLLAIAWWDWPIEHVRVIMAGTVEELERVAPAVH